MLDKLSWLVPQVYSSQEETLYSAKEMAYKLKTHFHGTKRSVLIARLEYDEEHNLWLEQQRVMVVDKYWPSFKRTIDNMLQQSEKRPTDKKIET
jgi:bacterioferritin (cytochrome b1)